MDKPAYLQLYERLKSDIVEGIYPFGSRLPSRRTMARDMGLSGVTVQHAYDLLCDEGYLESREKSGYFAAFRAEDGYAVYKERMPEQDHSKDNTEIHGNSNQRESANPQDIAKSSAPVFPISVLTKTMRRVMIDYEERILEKSPNQGRAELRDAIRLYLAQNREILVDSEQIIIGSGAEYLYSMIIGILGPDRIYALESPSYEKIEMVYRMAGAHCDLLPLGKDGIESSALSATKASVLHVSPYRSYPTGVTASASKRYEYIRWAHQITGRYLVEDDFESEFSVSSKPEETLFAISDDDNVIYLNTFSQTISPAIRVGYMVLPRHLADVFQEKLGFYSCTVPTFEQLVLARLLMSGDFQKHINRVRRAKRK